MAPAGVVSAGGRQQVTGACEALSIPGGVQGAQGLVIQAAEDLLAEALRQFLVRLQSEYTRKDTVATFHIFLSFHWFTPFTPTFHRATNHLGVGIKGLKRQCGCYFSQWSNQ